MQVSGAALFFDKRLADEGPFAGWVRGNDGGRGFGLRKARADEVKKKTTKPLTNFPDQHRLRGVIAHKGPVFIPQPELGTEQPGLTTRSSKFGVPLQRRGRQLGFGNWILNGGFVSRARIIGKTRNRS